MSQPIIMSFRGKTPKIHPTAFIAPGAVVIGDVEIGAETSVWFGCVIRGDVNSIRIGSRVNLQEGCVVHVASGEELVSGERILHPTGYATTIGDDVTIGHMALLHGCTVESGSFIGMKSSVMDGATVKSGGVLAAGALLTPGKTIGRGELWAGSPAKLWRNLGEDESALFMARADQYARLAQDYMLQEKSA